MKSIVLSRLLIISVALFLYSLIRYVWQIMSKYLMCVLGEFWLMGNHHNLMKDSINFTFPYAPPLCVPPYLVSRKLLLFLLSLMNQLAFSRIPCQWKDSVRALFLLISFLQHPYFEIIPPAARVNGVSLFVAEKYSFVQIYQSLLTSPSVDGYLDYFQLGVIINKAVSRENII